jgi:hypothetical protein
MRFSKAVVAGLAIGVALIICGVTLSLWLVPPGPITSFTDVAQIEKLVSFQSYLFLPALSAGVGLLAAVVGVRWRGLAGLIAVAPIVTVFVIGDHASFESLTRGGAVLAISWLTAQLAGRCLKSIGTLDALSPDRAALESRRSELIRRRLAR